MLLVGARMIENLISYFVIGDRPYLEMALDVCLVFYLNQREVQRAFGSGASRRRLQDIPVQTSHG